MVMLCPERNVKLLPCCQLQNSGPVSTKEQRQTMKELDYVKKNLEKLPMGPLPWPTGPPAPVMFLDAMILIMKLIAMERVVCFCEVRRNENLATVVASASAGFEHLQSIKEFVHMLTDERAVPPTQAIPMDLGGWLWEELSTSTPSLLDLSKCS